MKRIAPLLLLLFLPLTACTAIITTTSSQMSTTAAGLTIEEYTAGTQREESPSFKAELAKALKSIQTKRQEWRVPPAQQVAAHFAPLVSPAGCRLVADGDRFDLYKGDSLLMGDIEYVNAVYPSADGKSFILHGAKDAAPAIVTADGPLPTEIAEATQYLAGPPPIYAGDDLVYLKADPQTWEIQVMRNGEKVYGYLHPRSAYATHAGALVMGLSAWEGKWVLETAEAQVIVDGESLNQRLGYEEIFNFRLLKGKPFFFFKKEGKVGIWYDGQVLPQQYEKVHHYGCCESAAWNPRNSPSMVSFFAQRGGLWHYVEIGHYE